MHCWIVDHIEHFAHEVLLMSHGWITADRFDEYAIIGVQPNPIDIKAITILVSDVNENCSVSLREVLVVDVIPLKAAQVPVHSELSNLEHLKNVSFKELSDRTIGLLVGVDASMVFQALENRFGPEGTPMLSEFEVRPVVVEPRGLGDKMQAGSSVR